MGRIMLLFEAIIEANHRAAAGDTNSGLRPADFTGSPSTAALAVIEQAAYD